MSNIKIKTLEEVSLDELLNTFNEAFSDYLVPLQLTQDQLKGKIISDKINFTCSSGAFLDNQLIGFILHGMDIIDNKHVVYNAGTGVIPSERSKGITARMHDFVVQTLKKKNIDYLILEVISKNIRAIKAYEKVGYKIERKLMCYRGEIKTLCNNEINIRNMSEYDWEKMTSFWEIYPSWQNSSRVLNELKTSNKSYGAYIDNQLAGYIVYNPISNRIQQFAVDKNHRRRKIASTLFNHISMAYDKTLTIINVDDRSSTISAFLKNIGLKKFVEQIEMKLEMK